MRKLADQGEKILINIYMLIRNYFYWVYILIRGVNTWIGLGQWMDM